MLTKYMRGGLKTLFIILLLTIETTTIAAKKPDGFGQIVQKAEQAKAANNQSAAISYYAQLIDLYKKNPTREEAFAPALKAGGDLCYNSQRYIEALEFYTLSMNAARKSGKMDIYNRSMGNIGTIYDTFGDHERALYYYTRVYHDALKLKDSDLAAQVLTCIITCYCNMGKPDMAKKYFRLAQQTPQKNALMNTYYLYLLQGLIASAEHNTTAASYYYRLTLSHAERRMGETRYQTPILLELGNCYARQGRTDSALLFYNRCEATALKNETGAYLADLYKAMKKLYEKQGDKSKAAVFAYKADSIENHIYDQEQIRRAQNQLYKTEDLANTEQISSLTDTVFTQWLVIFLFVILVIGLIVLLCINLRQRREQEASYRLLIRKNQELIDQQEQSNLLREKYLQQSSETSTMRNDSNDDGAKGEDAKEVLLKRINEVMNNVAMICSSDFNMAMLCREVGSNKTYVSAVINESYKKNFKTLLNEHRIREAAHRLKEQGGRRETTIKDLAFQLGYNSPTSFIIAFKNVIGMTPAVYKNLMAKQSQQETADADDENDTNLIIPIG